jgi:hypothetical protein
MKTSEMVGFLDLNHNKSKNANPKFTKTTEDGNECKIQEKLAIDTYRCTAHEWLQHCVCA